MAQIKKLIIALDIDGVLAVPFYEPPEEVNEDYVKAYNLQILNICGYVHILVPGCLEFLQFLADLPNVAIYFFSSGKKKRNLELVPQLLDLAWDKKDPEKKKKYRELRSKVKIRSSEDIQYTYRMEGKNPDIYTFVGQLKKDLKIFGLSEEELENAILIDDEPAYVMRYQQFNFIKVPWCDEFSFFERLKADAGLEKNRFYRRDYDRSNTLFYATGFLLTVLEQVAEKGETIRQVIKRLQYIKSDKYEENRELIIVSKVSKDDRDQCNAIKNGQVLVTLEDDKIKYGYISNMGYLNTAYIAEDELALAGKTLPKNMQDTKGFENIKETIFDITARRNHTHILSINSQITQEKEYFYQGLKKLKEYNPGLKLILAAEFERTD